MIKFVFMKLLKINNSIKIFLLVLLVCKFISCEKEKEPEDTGQPLIFSSLMAEKDTIEAGESTKITATASGYKLTYNWTASAGDILGKGEEVIYAASPCTAGKNLISCSVKDGNNNSEKKEIYIIVE